MGLSHRSRLAGLLIALSLLGSCTSSATSSEAAPPAKPAPPRPDEVVVVVSTASLRGTLKGVRSFMDAVQPGASAALGEPMAMGGLANLIGAGSLDGLDLDREVHAVVLDAPLNQVVLVARIADEARLDKARGTAHLDKAAGWAIVGREDAIRVSAAWIRAVLLSRPAPADITATAFIPAIKAHHGAQIAATYQATMGAVAANAGGSEFIETMNGMVASMAESDEARLTLRTSAQRGEMEIALVPQSGSRLAAFAAAQRPSDYRLLEKLPAGAPTGMVMAGRLAAGPYRDAILAIAAKTMGLTGAEMTEALGQMSANFDQEVAATGSFAPGRFTWVQLYALNDGAAVDLLMEKLATSTSKGHVFKMGGMQFTATGIPEVTRYEGLPVRGSKVQVDLATVPDVQRQMIESMYGSEGITTRAIVADKTLVLAVGSAESHFEAIDAVRGKGKRFAPGPVITAQLDESRRRGESVVGIFDLLPVWANMRTMMAGATPTPTPTPTPGSAPIVVGFGASDGAIRMRMAFPSETIRQVPGMAR